jgi:hypothetical protein
MKEEECSEYLTPSGKDISRESVEVKVVVVWRREEGSGLDFIVGMISRVVHNTINNTARSTLT